MTQIHSHREQVLHLISQKGLLHSSDLAQMHIPRIVLTRMVAAGQLERVDRGLYRLSGTQTSEYESLLMVAIKAPQAVLCLLSALQFYELTTQLPRQVWIAMPHGSHTPRIDYPPIKMIQFSGAGYSEGIEVFERDGIKIRVYKLTKTIVDCFKHRNKVGLDVALEALKEARQKKILDMTELWHFAKICRVTHLMRPYLEAIE